MDITISFLNAVLGREGAKALQKAIGKSPQIAPLLLPRAALSWLQPQVAYEGEIPGIPNSHLQLSKAENKYNGNVSFSDLNYSFDAVTIEHVAAAVAVAVGIDISTAGSVADVTLVKLGKSIDTLVKAQNTKPKAETQSEFKFQEDKIDNGVKVHAFDRDGKHAGTAWFNHDGTALKLISIEIPAKHKDKGLAEALASHAEARSGRTVKKTELPGQTHKPTQQGQPEAPEAPQKQPKTSKPQLPKVPALKVEKRELSKQCPVCEGVQFEGAQFKGCMCFRDLAKHVKTVVYNDGLVLEFNPKFDRIAFGALRKALKE